MTVLEEIVPIFRTWIFDCDGVILDSNRIKTEAFRSVAMRYGEGYASELVSFHKAHGGISRYEKFRYFLSDVLKKPFCETEWQLLCDEYAKEVVEKLVVCPFTEGFQSLLETLRKNHKRVFVVSGGDELELKKFFRQKNMASQFDGIFGSPRSKVEILKDLGFKAKGASDAVFVGDAKTDIDAAHAFSMGFVFVKNYSLSEEFFTKTIRKKAAWVLTLATELHNESFVTNYEL